MPGALDGLEVAMIVCIFPKRVQYAGPALYARWRVASGEGHVTGHKTITGSGGGSVQFFVYLFLQQFCSTIRNIYCAD